MSADHDGEVEAAGAQGLRKHLDECRECRAFAADLARIGSMLDRWSAPEPRAGFTDALTARLRGEPSPATSRGAWLRALRPVAAAAAMIALACGIALAVAMNGEHSTELAETEDSVETLYAESFAPVPDFSIGGGYLALLQEGDGEP